jgi:hypothetical protein
MYIGINYFINSYKIKELHHKMQRLKFCIKRVTESNKVANYILWYKKSLLTEQLVII